MFAGALAFLACGAIASAASTGAAIPACASQYDGGALPLPTLNRFVRVTDQVALEPAGAPFAARTRAGSRSRAAPSNPQIVIDRDLDPG